MGFLSGLNPNKWLKGALGFTDAGLGNQFGSMFNDLTGVTQSAKQQYQYNKELQKLEQNFNAAEAEKTRVFNANESAKQRAWEAEQSSTAVQRRTADLKAAGINPVLAAGASADTGAGAAAQGAQASSGAGSTGAGVGGNPIALISELITAMNSAKKTNADIRNETKKTDVDAKNSTDLTQAQIANLNAMTGKTNYDTNTDKANNINGNTPYPIKIIKSAQASAKKEMQEWKDKANRPGWNGWKYKARNWLFRQ